MHCALMHSNALGRVQDAFGALVSPLFQVYLDDTCSRMGGNSNSSSTSSSSSSSGCSNDAEVAEGGCATDSVSSETTSFTCAAESRSSSTLPHSHATAEGVVAVPSSTSTSPARQAATDGLASHIPFACVSRTLPLAAEAANALQGLQTVMEELQALLWALAPSRRCCCRASAVGDSGRCATCAYNTCNAVPVGSAEGTEVEIDEGSAGEGRTGATASIVAAAPASSVRVGPPGQCSCAAPQSAGPPHHSVEAADVLAAGAALLRLAPFPLRLVVAHR